MKVDLEFSVYERGRKAPRWTIDSDLNGEMTLEEFFKFSKAALITISHDVLKEEQARGFDPKPVVLVDRKLGKPVMQVSPLGQIEFKARAQVSTVLLQIYDFILARSPVDTGLYKNSHCVFWNGILVAQNRAALDAWIHSNPEVKDKDIIRFVNIQPYARKLERYGVTAQRKRLRTKKSKDPRNRSGFQGRILAPNGTYYLATRAAERLFGLSAKFKTPSSGIPGLKRRRKRESRTYLYPSIIIRIGQGTL
jgi:hypothetical protein